MNGEDQEKKIQQDALCVYGRRMVDNEGSPALGTAVTAVNSTVRREIAQLPTLMVLSFRHIRKQIPRAVTGAHRLHRQAFDLTDLEIRR